jgi:transposase
MLVVIETLDDFETYEYSVDVASVTTLSELNDIAMTSIVKNVDFTWDDSQRAFDELLDNYCIDRIYFSMSKNTVDIDVKYIPFDVFNKFITMWNEIFNGIHNLKIQNRY